MILIQSLLNLFIYAVFMTFSFQSLIMLSQPITIADLKHEYVQLQLDHLSSRYQGVILSNNSVCFKPSLCIEMNHDRLVLTPGYQILIENVNAIEIKEREWIEIHFEHHRVPRIWRIKQKTQR